jgi:acyl-CoA synthetase (AMP-forming)/AMP-acid ligase II
MYPGDLADSHPTKPAIIMARTGEVITYAELHERASRLCNVLLDAGLKRGDHVAFCMENHPRYLEVVWGCHYAGLVYTACSSRLTSDELTYIIGDCEAKAYITSIYKRTQAQDIHVSCPQLSLKLMIDGVDEGYDSYEESIRNASPVPPAKMLDGIDMLYSSGTTGLPKGIEKVLPDTPIGTFPGLYIFAETFFGFDSSSIYLSTAPLYHAMPLRFNMGCQTLGGTCVVMEEFEAEHFLDLIDAHRITHTSVVPTMFVRLQKLDEQAKQGRDLSSLRYIIHAAAPCPTETKKAMIDYFGPIIHEFYAGSEGNGLVYCNTEQWLAHPGTVGSPVTAKIHICDEDGNEVPQGESGTIYFEGGDEFRYHNDPEKTISSRDPLGRGWTTLGDVGYLDDGGFLFLTDRKAFMIITGGVNVYPQEAENVLVNHPKVFDAAVFGIPHAEFGEEVKAVVQPIEMPRTDEARRQLERELIAFCRDRLADVKCPRSIDFRTELPRHPTGKLYKRQLKDEYWAAAGRNI